MLIRLIVWTIIFYFLYKIVKYVARLMSASSSSELNNNVHKNNNSNQQYKIEEKDVIDADFTEIKENEEQKKK